MDTTRTKNPYLVVLHVDKVGMLEVGHRYELKDPEVIIGSDLHSDIQLPAELVSLRHACLRYTEGHWHIYDLTNVLGLSVDNIVVTHYKFLRDGEIFKLGGVYLKLFSGVGLESRYEDESYERSMVDSLTQVYNRRCFNERMQEEIARLSRKRNGPLSLIMFDIDHFRTINNKFGHLAGDHILREIASRVQKRVRKDEMVFRYGGEEFAILLPQTTKQEAMVLAEQIRVLIEDSGFIYQEHKIPITISVGVRTIQEEIQPEMFIGYADQALYMAKAKGRNMVIG